MSIQTSALRNLNIPGVTPKVIEIMANRMGLSCSDTEWALYQLWFFDTKSLRAVCISANATVEFWNIVDQAAMYSKALGEPCTIGKFEDVVKVAVTFMKGWVHECKKIWRETGYRGTELDVFIDSPIQVTFSKRISNRLRRLGITNVRKLIAKDIEGFDIAACYGFGETSVDEIVKVLADHSIALRSLGTHRKYGREQSKSWKGQ